ncbi:MAG: glycosyltransferase family 2 protein [Acidobacteriia bacterium]|nr:glycosyltransferase family 2 protein [Terriglobia bacterium]
MAEQQILLSIVVPTRNRARYAISMIESILDLKGDVFELVVSDNSDDNTLADWVTHQCNDPRLIYKRVTGALSMTENHNHAFGMASGEFVCLIGDDDTVLPTILDGCRCAHQQKLDALTPGTTIRYCWPDLVHRYWGKRQAGKIYADRWEGQVWVGNPKREAFACMRRAGQGTAWLPKLYHGIVRRSLLEELKAETGAYCFGVSPDVYMAMALARKVIRQACTDTPLTIPGSSGGSNSGRAAKREHKGDLKKDPHMVAFRDEIWPEGNPEFFSIETVWAQAALEAVRRANWEEMLSVFNFPYLYAICFLRHSDYFHEIRRAISVGALTRGRSRGLIWLSIAMQIARAFGATSWYYIRRSIRPTPRGYSQEYGTYPDIRSASEFVSTILGEKASWKSAFTSLK